MHYHHSLHGVNNDEAVLAALLFFICARWQVMTGCHAYKSKVGHEVSTETAREMYLMSFSRNLNFAHICHVTFPYPANESHVLNDHKLNLSKLPRLSTLLTIPKR